MDKLHLFETAEEHYNTYLGSGYTEPWVGYDIESNDTTYNYGVLEENSKLYASMYRFIQDYYNYNDNGEMMEVFKRFKTLMKTNVYNNLQVSFGNTSGGSILANLYADTDCINGEKSELVFSSSIPSEIENESEDVIINYLLTEHYIKPAYDSTIQCFT
jgi:hypothetical protein